MKRLTLVCFLSCLFSITIHSQIELKTDIVKILNTGMYLSGEYLLNPWWGIDLGVGFENEKNSVDEVTLNFQQTFELNLTTKWYLLPDNGNDRFFLGQYWLLQQLDFEEFESSSQVFGKKDFVEKGFVFGFLIGYKWIGKTGFFAEVSFGGGMKNVNRIYENLSSRGERIIDPHRIVQLQFGCRFGGK